MRDLRRNGLNEDFYDIVKQYEDDVLKNRG